MNKDWKLPRSIPICLTVGDLRDSLRNLPRELVIRVSMEKGVKPVIFNRNRPDVHLGLEENDGTWEDPADE